MASSQDLPDTFRYTKPIDFTKSIDTSNLKDKSVIVTGGSSGLGGGCVTALAKAGAYVTILDISEENGKALASDLTEKGHHVQFVKTDTTSFPSQTAGFKSAISFSPSKTLDIVLASAGVSGSSVQEWLDTVLSNASPDSDPAIVPSPALSVNLTGVFYTAHLALYYFKQTASTSASTSGSEGSSKQLIFFASLAGYIGLNIMTDYVTSKHGVRGLWKSIRYNTSILGASPTTPKFRSNLIAPTYIRTPMTASVTDRLEGIGIQLGEIEDCVEGVMRVVCDESVFGRAVCIAPMEKVAGDRNFDLGDDWEGEDAGPEVQRRIRDGTLKNLQLVGLPQNGEKF